MNFNGNNNIGYTNPTLINPVPIDNVYVSEIETGLVAPDYNRLDNPFGTVVTNNNGVNGNGTNGEMPSLLAPLLWIAGGIIAFNFLQ